MKTPARLRQEALRHASRRQFLQACPAGVAALGLAANGSTAAAASLGHDLPAAAQGLSDAFVPTVARAQRVIHLNMLGGPSQFELFDYKPMLRRWSGSRGPAEWRVDRRAVDPWAGRLLGPQCSFSQHGESGTWVSDRLPAFSQIVDSVSFIHTVHTDAFDHASAQRRLHCGHAAQEQVGSLPQYGASLGARVTAGLGCVSPNLPGHVVLFSGGSLPAAGPLAWGHGHLPSNCQGIRCLGNGDPVLFLCDPAESQRPPCSELVPAISRFHRQAYQRLGNPLGIARVGRAATTYAMQAAAAEATDLAQETREVRQLYGVRPGRESFANHCLLARRLVERGVRYVQLFNDGWDAHGRTAAESLQGGFQRKCGEIDRPIAALLIDLERSGLLDDTLVVWGGEFGRTPTRSAVPGTSPRWAGRDHHPAASTMWLAGAGIRPGVHYGQTDELGYAAVENPVSVDDVQATVLELAGLNTEPLSDGQRPQMIAPDSILA